MKKVGLLLYFEQSGKGAEEAICSIKVIPSISVNYSASIKNLLLDCPFHYERTLIPVEALLCIESAAADALVILHFMCFSFYKRCKKRKLIRVPSF